MVVVFGGGDSNHCGGLGRIKSLSDMVFGFFEESDDLLENCEWVDQGEDDEISASAEEKFAFWISQTSLLQAALSSKSSLETKVGKVTENALRRIRSAGENCSCSKNNDGVECRNCIRKIISDELQRAGFDCGLCKSKWKSSPDIPAGEHSYLDVVHRSINNSKRSPTRVVIELNFRSEFEMARASRDYNSLVSNLPEVFVGKPEKMKAVIKIVCAAAKRCMKDNKMHMGPWRKYKYMQAKWLTSSSERVMVETETKIPLVDNKSTGDGRRTNRPKASMLTFDLHRTAVEVM